MPDDPGGARLLRASGSDELPPIINVLRGDMSIVGPRPCIPSEARLYQPWQRETLQTLPGTSPDFGRYPARIASTFDEMMHLDIRYARAPSRSSLDLKIILLTPAALVVQVMTPRPAGVPPQSVRILRPHSQTEHRRWSGVETV